MKRVLLLSLPLNALDYWECFKEWLLGAPTKEASNHWDDRSFRASAITDALRKSSSSSVMRQGFFDISVVCVFVILECEDWSWAPVGGDKKRRKCVRQKQIQVTPRCSIPC